MAVCVAGADAGAGCGVRVFRLEHGEFGRQGEVQHCAVPRVNYPASYYCGLSGSASVYDPSGGTVAEAEENSVFKDFTTLTGVSVNDQYEPDMSKFEAAEQNGASIPWDVLVIPRSPTSTPFKRRDTCRNSTPGSCLRAWAGTRAGDGVRRGRPVLHGEHHLEHEKVAAERSAPDIAHRHLQHKGVPREALFVQLPGVRRHPGGSPPG